MYPTNTIGYITLYCNRFLIHFTQIIHEKQTQKTKKTSLILQYRTLRSTIVTATAGTQGLASSEQARRVTDWRRERRWEMVQLKDRQQQDMEGNCNFTHA